MSGSPPVRCHYMDPDPSGVTELQLDKTVVSGSLTAAASITAGPPEWICLIKMQISFFLKQIMGFPQGSRRVWRSHPGEFCLYSFNHSIHPQVAIKLLIFNSLVGMLDISYFIRMRPNAFHLYTFIPVGLLSLNIW